MSIYTLEALQGMAEEIADAVQGIVRTANTADDIHSFINNEIKDRINDIPDKKAKHVVNSKLRNITFDHPAVQDAFEQVGGVHAPRLDNVDLPPGGVVVPKRHWTKADLPEGHRRPIPNPPVTAGKSFPNIPWTHQVRRNLD